MSKEKNATQFIPKKLASWVLIGAVTYFLLIEHRQHLVAWLPFLILALCPLMHFFMHGGHGGHGGHGDQDARELEESAEDAYRRGLDEGRKQSEHNHQDH